MAALGTARHVRAVVALGCLCVGAALPPEVAEWRPTGSPSADVKRVFVSNETFPEAAGRSGYQFPRYDARMLDGDEVKLQSVHDTWMTLSNERRYTLRGRTISLRAASGSYCSVPMMDPEGAVRCDQPTPPYGSWFLVSGIAGKVTLKDMRAERFCTDEKEQGLRCTKQKASAWETFDIVDAPGGKFAIKSGRSGYFCADRGAEQDGLVCDATEMTGDAIFDHVTDAALFPSVIHSTDESEAAVFVVEREDFEGRIALRCKDDLGGYLVAHPITKAMGCSKEGDKHLLVSRVTWWDAKTAVLQAPQSKLFLEAGDPEASNSEVLAANEEGSGWALWKVFLTGGFETVRPMIRGVNLGNWLLLERWMAKEIFQDESGQMDFIGTCPPVDEYGLMRELDRKVAQRRMEQHWKTWITEKDIAWLASVGINSVRVPFGYWVVHASPPFISGQLKYLDDLFDRCERHSVAILLDFHGLKGSQTGNPTSGNCGGCGRQDCGKTTIDFLEEADLNLDVISQLARRYSNRSAYLGFEIANEVSSSVDSLKTMKFYERAYDIIRYYSADALVIIFATFNPSTYPFPNFQHVAEDVHIYFGMGFGHPTTDHRENLEHASKAVAGLRWNVLVGEWSLGASGQHTEEWTVKHRAEFFRDFARMQLQAWETHTIGWFYWSYKTAYLNSTWNFRDMCEGGWLPGCQPGLTFAPANWWSQPSCAFAYLDGGCDEIAVAEIEFWKNGRPYSCMKGGSPNVPFIVGLFLALLVFGGAAAAFVVSQQKPEVAAAAKAWAGRAWAGTCAWASRIKARAQEKMGEMRLRSSSVVVQPGSTEKGALISADGSPS